MPESKFYTGKAEFLSVVKGIGELVAKGHSRRYIYEFFVEQGVFTMSYTTFMNYMNGKFKLPKAWTPPCPNPVASAEPFDTQPQQPATLPCSFEASQSPVSDLTKLSMELENPHHY
ncbi:MAG: TraK family protein [Treponema sp.]|jgi:hypothetical protein|nr:TraK family protein [Treponema sp.]